MTSCWDQHHDINVLLQSFSSLENGSLHPAAVPGASIFSTNTANQRFEGLDTSFSQRQPTRDDKINAGVVSSTRHASHANDGPLCSQRYGTHWQPR